MHCFALVNITCVHVFGIISLSLSLSLSHSLSLDIDECSLGPQQNGHNCPTNSTCNNTVGSFDCECHPGFVMTQLSNGGRRCKGVCVCVCRTDY